MPKTKIQKRKEAETRSQREIFARIQCGHRHSDEGFANCPAKKK